MASVLSYIADRSGLERQVQGALLMCLERCPDFVRNFRELAFPGETVGEGVAEEHSDDALRFDLILGGSHPVELKCWAWFTRNQAADLAGTDGRLRTIIVPTARVSDVRAVAPRVRVVSWDDVEEAAEGTAASLVLAGIARAIDFGNVAAVAEVARDLRALATQNRGATHGHMYSFLGHFAARLQRKMGDKLVQNERLSISRKGGRTGWPYYGYYATLTGNAGSEAGCWLGFYCDSSASEAYLVVQIYSGTGFPRAARRAIGCDDNGEVFLWALADNDRLEVDRVVAEAARLLATACAADG